MHRPRLTRSSLVALLAVVACAGPQAAAPRAEPCPAAVEVQPVARTAPTGTAAIPYDLPRAPELVAPPPELPAAREHAVVSSVLGIDVTASGAVHFNGKLLSSADELVELARAAVAKDPEVRAVIRADRSVPWSTVVAVMDRLKQGGCTKIAFGVSPMAP